MDVGDGQHHVDLLPLRLLHGLPHRVDIRTGGPGEGGDHRSLDLARDTLHRLEVAGGREREAGLDDVDAQKGELARDDKLLVGVERSARRLLPVAQRGVEDVDAVVYSIWCAHQFFAFPSGFNHGIMARSSVPTFSMSSPLARCREALKVGRPAWFSRIQVRAKVPSWLSRRIGRISSRTAALMTRGPLT